MEDVKERHERKDWWEGLGKLVRAAEGLDRSWMPEGSCRNYPGGKDENGWTWWMAQTCAGKPKNTRDRLLHEAAKAALLVCGNCPVQWRCVDYGVESMSITGIYGVDTQNMAFLQRDDNRCFLQGGPDSGLPVQEYVTRVRLGVYHAEP